MSSGFTGVNGDFEVNDLLLRAILWLACTYDWEMPEEWRVATDPPSFNGRLARSFADALDRGLDDIPNEDLFYKRFGKKAMDCDRIVSSPEGSSRRVHEISRWRAMNESDPLELFSGPESKEILKSLIEYCRSGEFKFTAT